MIRNVVSTFILFAVLLFQGCDSSDPAAGEAPSLLSEDVFELQTDLFNNTANAKQAAGPNFLNAALRVWPVSFIVAANMILPHAVTAAAVQADPIFEDGSWVWESTATFNNDGVTFRLTATPGGTGHDWSAEVSYFDVGSQQQIDNFELYSARTQNLGTEGSWSLFYRIDDASVNVLNADFVKESETKKTLTFSIPESAEENGGDSVTYMEDGDIRSFHWIQVEQEIEHLVRWNATTGAGSITATNYNGGAESCWDANGDDMACAI